MLLLGTPFTGMLNRLFQAGDVGADAVETTLHHIVIVTCVSLQRPLLLDIRFHRALFRYRRFEHGLLLAQMALGSRGLFVQDGPAQRL